MKVNGEFVPYRAIQGSVALVLLTLALVGLLALPVAARKPTNDAAAFRTFDLYGQRTASGNTIDHLNFAGYPASLASPPPLLVMRPTPGSADSVALFNSFAKDAIYLEVQVGPTQSFSTYAVAPTQFATSLGTLMMGVNIYAGSGGFADFGKQLATATVTYADGDTSIARLVVGTYVRDFFDSGALTCGPASHPLYVTRPSDSRSAFIYETGGNYLDAQEFLLPRTKWRKRITSIRVDGTLLDHSCPFVPHIYGGSRLSGLTIWPNFTIENASSQPVVRQSQFTNVDHGGYMFGGTPVGTRRTTNVTACQVAAQAMTYTYAGFSTTVNALNTYLQQNRGYQPDQVAVVTFLSPTGNAIRYTAAGGTELKVGDLCLVEHGTFTNPLATYQVTVAGRNGQATRVTQHNATIPSVGDPGRVYWNMKPRVADAMTSSPQLHTIDLPDSPQLPAQVESLLVRDVAVQVNVPGHFVVCSGWTSSFRPGGTARGTYWIKDPFDTRNYTKLIEGKYRNTFGMARYVVATGFLDAEPAAVAGGTPSGLGILASGAYRVEVTDPLGRRMMRDAGTGEGIYEIPEGSIEDESSEHDNGGDVDDPLTGYDVEIPDAIDGNYTVRVYANDGVSLTASGYDATGIFATDGRADTTVGVVGNIFTVSYSAAAQTVSMAFVGTVGVGAHPPRSGALRVLRSPTTGPVEFVVATQEQGTDVLDIFDVSGRRVDAIDVAGGGGTIILQWNWRSAGGRAGVYLARLRSRSGEVARFVVLN